MKWMLTLPSLADIIKNDLATGGTSAERMMKTQLSSLTPTHYTNFNDITNKYPGMSKDLVMSMVRQGLNANTPGIEKITTMDGIAALKTDAFNIDKIKKQEKPNRGPLGYAESAFKEGVYDPFKGFTRLVFSGIRSIYDATTTVGRDVVAMSRGEKGAGQQFVKDIAGGALADSTVGQMLRGKSTGSGFFVTPESQAGRAQARAMGKYGRVNGESFTIGRGVFNGIGMNPESNAYHVMSGVLDATLNVGLDPSTWWGPGAVGKLITQSKKVTKLTNELADLTKAGFDADAKLTIAGLEKTGEILVNKVDKTISSNFKRYANKFKSKEQEILALQSAIDTAKIATTKKLLNTESKYFTLEAADQTVKTTLAPGEIAKWVTTHPGLENGELVQAVGRLTADMKNTGGFFDGYTILDEIPQYGKISIGAHGADEYVLTANSAKKLKVLDMADDFAAATPEMRVAESLRRSKMADALDKLGKNPLLPESRTYKELADELRSQAGNLDGFVGSLFLVSDQLIPVKTMGSLIGEIMLKDNVIVMSKISDLVQKIWKIDGFSNIRSIYGEAGGVVITKGERLAATRAEIGNAAAEFADPSNQGPNIIKLLESIKGSKESLAARQNELDELLNGQLDLESKENYFKLLREKAHGDPEILKTLIQDPDNIGIKNLLNLELDVANNNVIKEALRAQIGITDNFMGNVGQDFAKPLAFILGRQFQPVAELIAKQTDPVQLRNLFKGRLDDTIIKELTAADNVDDVLKIFLNQFVPGGDVLKIKKALSLGVKVAVNPVARLTPMVNMRAIKYAENIDRVFNRLYVRSVVVPLNDVTRLNTVIENWMGSVGLTKLVRSGIITQNAQQKIIADTQRAIFAATTNSERSAAVYNGIGSLMEEAGRALGIPTDEILKLKNATKISGSEATTTQSYALANALENKGAGLVLGGGKTVRLEKGILESQLSHDVLHLPDTRVINNSIIAYKTNIPLYGTARSLKVLIAETNDMWRTGQLVGRFSYIVRNVAEMQMRQFFSGHNSLFNNPIGFISMVMANPEGNAIQKMLAKTSKYNVNAMGKFWKSTDAEIELSDSIIASRAMLARGHSVSDYGGTGRIGGAILKGYDDVTVEHPQYLEGLAWTINNFSSDKFMPDVIRVMQTGRPEAKLEYVDNLIKTFDMPDNKLKSLVQSIYDDNEGMREILLINPFKETGPGVVKENMNRENILIWLFDEKQTDTVAGQLNLLGGQGSQRNLVMDLIRDGQIKTPINGKMTRLYTPYRQTKLTSEQVMLSEKAFTKQIAALFNVDGMAGGLAKVVTETSVGSAIPKGYKKFGDWFFSGATKIESGLNFGPEFHAVYWDYIAGYAGMLDTPDLIKLRNNANKAFPALIGKNVIGRRPRVVREISKELKKREANPNYVHKGGATLRTIDSMASEQGANYVKNLFYDASEQKQWANAYRLVAPFAQAQYNTLYKWGQLTWSNPVPIYKFGKAFDALTKEGSNVIYDITNVTYDDQQGFLYRDENNPQLRFKTPIVGSVIGALAGRSMSGKDALQITSPLESMNLAFGSMNPIVPGFGPAMVALYQATGKTQAFGPIDDVLRDMITPFGEPKSVGDLIFPSWLKKFSTAWFSSDAATQRGVKDWASQLASTGRYGDNPLSVTEDRQRLFNDAERMAKTVNILTGLFQSISPATPTQEILLSIKNPNNKMNFMTMTMLYKEWENLQKKYPGDYGTAVTELADKFGMNNLLIAVSGTTPGARGTEDAWTFLNNNPDAVSKYAEGNNDITPYFFPGGDYSLKYYNWQKKSGQRRTMSTNEIMQESQNMVYGMLKDQIVEKQIAGRYNDIWYTEQVAILNKSFDGAKPVDSVITGVGDNKIATIETALQDPAFQKSPVYKQASEFYAKFKPLKDLLNEIKVSNYAELSSKGGVPTLMRNELVVLGEKLMTENPEFSRMYYGVFAGILKESK
jgi:hypothetical protein